ncbi:MAG: murein biosynthesis integral membrane protein MurJ [Candidatus Omnitrophica bacterium]|nr:murein biosynthesis integral membrane protein MurJ [Candidatus Omnitrophota bacterium]
MSIDKNHPVKIMRSTSVMSLGTLASRILGFIRDIIFARFFGTAAGADAFVVAFRLPNLFRDMIGEGAANSSFVPVMTEYKETRPQELAEFLNVILAWAFIILCAITFLGVVLAPVVVRLIAPGFAADPGKINMTVMLTRMMFPYLVFIGLTALFSAIQFTYGSFTMPAFGPCWLNVALIASTLASVWWMKQPVYGLAYGVLAGGAIQLYFQWRPLRKHGVKFSWALTLNHPGARQIGKLLLPRLVGSAVYQLNIFVDTICASLTMIVGAGGIAAIYYANRIVQFPMGIFGVALASAALPAFSSFAVSGKTEDFKRTVLFTLENILLLMLPMTIFLSLFSTPIVHAVFQRGEFNAYSTTVTSSALFFFSLGLLGYGAVKILVSAFHAMQDTQTPVKVALVSLAVNAGLNVALMFPMKISGIALASAISSVVNVVLLLTALKKRVGNFSSQFVPFLGKIIVAGAAQAAASFLVWQNLSGLHETWRLGIVFVAGLLVYGAISWILGIEQVVGLRKIFSLRV